ncbi:relaxase/mobilization nuclease domain-containing protein [Chitinophaga pendula]|uniref:relaxase/mobilization nuclease domain-containing protein n=1 Tax=Chitinophaga TaxID=79328 RepID=UPI000BB019C8|nr:MULTISPECIES: relaxase/mobilization nuclease domain-containing protein [Chitinophaga]ASZ13703.1 mobilization protein [Chitinophaga sp. MD30]UCJ08680.1 relaxase/mobilization nuclease domain-containing protein [Chitinophaga pendula]
MISKVITGKSFYGCCRYICADEQRAEILEAEGVREYSYWYMGHDFEVNRQQLPDKRKAVFHGILSFYPGEQLTNESMAQIAREYLEKIGITDTQYVITKHTDTNHLHLHIVANLVNNKGQSISDSWIGLRGKKAAQQLTQKYQLIPAIEKKIALTNLQALNNEEQARYEIFQAIESALHHCKILPALEKELTKKGIDIQYKYKGDTQQLQGISFKKGLYAFKGSSIDRKYSITGLQKAMQQQMAQEQKPQNRRGLRL